MLCYLKLVSGDWTAYITVSTSELRRMRGLFLSRDVRNTNSSVRNSATGERFYYILQFLPTWQEQTLRCHTGFLSIRITVIGLYLIAPVKTSSTRFVT